MSNTLPLTVFHAPRSRSGGVLGLLEELGTQAGADYTLQVLNLKAGDQRSAGYLAINPMGKVPALRHGDTVVTEQVAIYQYLAEVFPAAGLSPAVGDPRRGAYLRWLAFYGACFEPAVIDRSMQREPAPQATSPYGNFDAVLTMLTRQLEAGDYLLGERFSSADALWGSALTWTTSFQLVPLLPPIQAYIDRVNARPGMARGRHRDAELAAAQA